MRRGVAWIKGGWVACSMFEGYETANSESEMAGGELGQMLTWPESWLFHFLFVFTGTPRFHAWSGVIFCIGTQVKSMKGKFGSEIFWWIKFSGE